MGCTPSAHSDGVQREVRPLDGSGSADRLSSISEERRTLTPTPSRYSRRAPSGIPSHRSGGRNSLTEEPSPSWPRHAINVVSLHPHQPPLERCATPRPTDIEQNELWADVVRGAACHRESPSDPPLVAALSETALRIRDKYEEDLDESPHMTVPRRSLSGSFGSEKALGGGGTGSYENPLGPLGDVEEEFIDEIGMPPCTSTASSDSLTPPLSPCHPFFAKAPGVIGCQDAEGSSPDATAWDVEGPLADAMTSDSRHRLTRRIIDWGTGVAAAAPTQARAIAPHQ